MLFRGCCEVDAVLLMLSRGSCSGRSGIFSSRQHSLNITCRKLTFPSVPPCSTSGHWQLISHTFQHVLSVVIHRKRKQYIFELYIKLLNLYVDIQAITTIRLSILWTSKRQKTLKGRSCTWTMDIASCARHCWASCFGEYHVTASRSTETENFPRK